MEQARFLKQICDARRLSVATAESVTVGRLQSLIASVSGASTFFLGGITAYSIDQKVDVLGVDRAHAERVACVSPRVAAEMALGATRLFKADIGVSTAGYAEAPPDGQIAHAFYAIWDHREPSGEPVRSGKLTGRNDDRIRNQQVYAESVLSELVAYLSAREGIESRELDVFRVERLDDQRYRLGQQVVANILEIRGAIKAVKRTIPIKALQINQAFEVVTTEGIMRGKTGDWLIQGVVGEVYICPDDVFKKSYEHIP